MVLFLILLLIFLKLAHYFLWLFDECKVFQWHWIICIFKCIHHLSQWSYLFPQHDSTCYYFIWVSQLLFYLSITGSDSLMDTASRCWSRKDSYGLGKWRTFLLRTMTWKTKYQARACPWSRDFLSSITSSCAAALTKMDKYTRKGRTSQQQRWGLRHRRMNHRNWWRMLWLMKLQVRQLLWLCSSTLSHLVLVSIPRIRVKFIVESCVPHSSIIFETWCHVDNLSFPHICYVAKIVLKSWSLSSYLSDTEIIGMCHQRASLPPSLPHLLNPSLYPSLPLFLHFLVLGIEPKVLYLLWKCFTTKLIPQPTTCLQWRQSRHAGFKNNSSRARGPLMGGSDFFSFY